MVDEPDRKNYDLSELGLSTKAAKALYAGKVNPQVVNRLLENSRFAQLTQMIALYFDDTLAAGFAAQSQMYQTISDRLLGVGANQPELKAAAVQAAQDAKMIKSPVYQADLTTIQHQFMAALREIKQETGNNTESAQAMTKEITEQMFGELTKGQDMRQPSITPEQTADAITGMLSSAEMVDQEALGQLNQAIAALFQSMADKQSDANKNAK